MASTPTVLNLAEEALAIRRLVPLPQSLLQLFTSLFHVRRSQCLFERQGLKVLPLPVDYQS